MASRKSLALLALLEALVLGGCGAQKPAAASPKQNSDSVAAALKTPADIAEASLPSIVAIVTEHGLGTGFVVSKDGLIVTNLHVVAGHAKVIAVLHDRREIHVVGVYNADPKRDLVILRIEADKLEPLVLGDSDKVRAGEVVVAIGHPLGLTDTVSSGLVGAVRKLEPGISVLQISAPIAPGSSGGPIFDDRGRVIGVATAILLGGQNLNLGVPINDVKALLERADPVSMQTFAEVTRLPSMPPVKRQVPHHPVSALNGCNPERIGLIVNSIENAVQVGAPLYNRGDFSSCYHVYEGAALDLERRLGRTCRVPVKALADGRKRAARLGAPHAQAWAMRDAFDGLMDVIRRWAAERISGEKAPQRR